MKNTEVELETTEEEILDSSDSDISDSHDDEKEKVFEEIFPTGSSSRRTYLKNLWQAMTSPVPERDLEGMWYAGIYYKTKGTLYIGCVTRLFLTEEDGCVDSIEMDCLKPAAAPSSTTLEAPPQHLGKILEFLKDTI